MEGSGEGSGFGSGVGFCSGGGSSDSIFAKEDEEEEVKDEGTGEYGIVQTDGRLWQMAMASKVSRTCLER